MTREEFLNALCEILAEVKNKHGEHAFPCICGQNPLSRGSDRINDWKGERFLELAEMFVEELNEETK